MKLSKVSYRSAVFFGVFTLVTQLIMGIVQYFAQDALIAQGLPPVTGPQAFIIAPLVSGVVAYIFTALIICIYNFVARNGYPISWEVGKK